MTSKFFTWTKGDRRNAAEALRSGGLVPIAVEGVAFKGMDCSRRARDMSKQHRKPLPLSFDQSTHHSSKHSDMMNEPITLPDATLQPATNPTVGMSDTVRSPPLSAYLSAREWPSGLLPINGRPRSHTAPPTPLAEAPSRDLAELPGSLPFVGQSIHANPTLPACPLSAQTKYGATIERPHTSPQEAGCTILISTRKIDEGLSETVSQCPSARGSRSNNTSPRQPINNHGPATFGHHGVDTLISNDNDPVVSSLQRQKWSFKPSNMSESAATPQSRSKQNVAKFASPFLSTPAVPFDQTDTEIALMDQISIIRTSHEAHIRSLKKAHEKEIESHKSYISFLEKHRALTAATPPAIQHRLTIDTSQSGTRSGDFLHSGTSDTCTTAQSFESSIGYQRCTSHDTLAEVEALKRKLSLSIKAHAETSELRNERDQLRDAVERSDRRISQLKDIVRKTKERQKALKNTNAHLEDRLEVANVGRVDILEGYHEACSRVRILSERESLIAQKLEELSTGLGRSSSHDALAAELIGTSSTRDLRRKHTRARSDTIASLSIPDHILRQFDYLKCILEAKNEKVRHLETLHSSDSYPQSLQKSIQDKKQSAQIAELEASPAEDKRMLGRTQTNSSKRYDSLLQDMLRPGARSTGQGLQSAMPQTGRESVVTTVGQIWSTSAGAHGAAKSVGDRPEQASRSEKELERCINKIAAHKKEVSAYKRELKEANAKIEDLQRPPTSGLGISVLQVSRPHPEAVASGDTPAPLPAHSSSSSSAVDPRPMPITPQAKGIRKRLPSPPASCTVSPAQDTSPPPVMLARGETMRSVSESIISSYTKRCPPEPGPGLTTPPTGASSATAPTPLKPARSPSSTGPPLSKFNSKLATAAVYATGA